MTKEMLTVIILATSQGVHHEHRERGFCEMSPIYHYGTMLKMEGAYQSIDCCVREGGNKLCRINVSLLSLAPKAK